MLGSVLGTGTEVNRGELLVFTGEEDTKRARACKPVRTQQERGRIDSGSPPMLTVVSDNSSDWTKKANTTRRFPVPVLLQAKVSPLAPRGSARQLSRERSLLLRLKT